MAEEEVAAAAEAEAEAKDLSPVQSDHKRKLDEDLEPHEEEVPPAEPVVPPAAEAEAESVSPAQSDHKRKLEEDLEPQEEKEVQTEPVVFPPAESPVDWNAISIEVQNSIPDAKRPRLDEDSDSSNYLIPLENAEQLSEGNLEAGNPRQPSVENNQRTDGDDSSVGEDSSVGDLSSAQQPLSEDQTEMEVPNNKDEVKEKSIIEQEHIETTLVNHVEQPVAVTVKVDLTQCFVTDQVFDSREALIEWCQEVGRNNMSVLVISKSRKPVPGRAARLELGCERGGVYRDHNKKMDTPGKKDLAKKRETGTRKCGCPFTLKGVWMSGDKWKVRVHCGEHNHELPETLVGHSYVARLKDEEKQILVDLTRSGVRPRQVLTTLKERSKENMSTMRTIYNARATLKLMEMEGKSVMQQVIKLLVKHHYVEWHRRDEETDELKDIFWAHPESIQLVRCFHSVLMVNCTYKTNRFRTPLFEIVGVTSTGKSFTAAFVFMETETEEHYTWAFTRLKTLFSPSSLPSVFVTDGEPALINAINTVFPQVEQLLCTFHISKNVSENCKQHFERAEEFERFMKDWTSVTNAWTMEKFVDALCDFVLTWASYPACVQYIRETWLGHKERFVLAWTKYVKHFGSTTTNSAESSTKLKSHLGSSASNFATCWMAMHQMICNELIDIKASFEKSLISVRHEYMLPAFKELRGNVSLKALELLLVEHNRSEDVGIDLAVCGCVLRLSHGLPCAHEIVQFCREGRPIPLSEIDLHWRYLSAVPMPEERCEFDYLPVLELLRQRWAKASEPERKIMEEKLWEIATSTTT